MFDCPSFVDHFPTSKETIQPQGGAPQETSWRIIPFSHIYTPQPQWLDQTMGVPHLFVTPGPARWPTTPPPQDLAAPCAALAPTAAPLRAPRHARCGGCAVGGPSPGGVISLKTRIRCYHVHGWQSADTILILIYKWSRKHDNCYYYSNTRQLL